MTTKGEWVIGSLVTTNQFIKHMEAQHTKHWIVTSSFGNGGWFNITSRVYVKEESVGQYIGRSDDKGNEIFEGDIVSSDFYLPEIECIGAFHFEDGAFCVDDHEVDAFKYGRLTVIGNKLENPELLEKES